MANAVNHYFIDSVAAIAQTFPPVSLNVSQINTMEPAFNLQNVTETEVIQIMKSIKTSRATDVYGMDTSMLKELGTTLAYPFTKLINQSFTQGTQVFGIGMGNSRTIWSEQTNPEGERRELIPKTRELILLFLFF